MKSATLREIASHAGVHLSTASHVLNGGRGSTRVSGETRDRVLASARLLGYSADRAAQQLRTRRSRVIGLLVGGLENPFFARMVSLCSEVLEREGYEVVLAERRRDEPADEHLLNTLLARRLDGLLVWSETTTEARERLLQPDLENCVVIGYSLPGRDSVEAMLHEGIAAALDHLRAQGRKRIGFLAPGFAVARYGDPRHAIYCEKVAAWGEPERIFLYDGAAFEIGAARARAETLWSQDAPTKERPDALLCFNDMAAVGALMGLRRAGARVPEDVALVGCDDLPLAAEMDVPLSSVAYPMEAVCDAAVRLLMERIRRSAERTTDVSRPASRCVHCSVAFHARASSGLGCMADDAGRGAEKKGFE